MQLFKIFPFYYYLISRYTLPSKRVLYVIKYYGFGLLILWNSGYTITHEYIFDLLIGLFAFWNLYDLLCYKNDIKGVPKDRENVLSKFSNINFERKKWALHLIINIILVSQLESRFLFFSLALQLVLFLTFTLHNHSKEPICFITFYGLYVLKTLCYLTISEISSRSIWEFLIVFNAFNISYLPKYISRKLKYQNKAYFEPIVIKNAVFLLFLVLDFDVLILLIFTSLITLLEYSLTRLGTKKDLQK